MKKRIYRFVGDLHGNEKYKELMTPNSIQLGDLDVRGYEKWHFDDGYPRFIVPGNHDFYPIIDSDESKPQEIARNLYAFPRGFIHDKVMFISGADSPNKAQLSSGFDWFSEETITQAQFERILRSDFESVETVVAHDFPPVVYGHEIVEGHCLALNNLWTIMRPKIWIGGHYHRNDTRFIQGTLFITVDQYDFQEIPIPCNLSSIRL